MGPLPVLESPEERVQVLSGNQLATWEVLRSGRSSGTKLQWILRDMIVDPVHQRPKWLIFGTVPDTLPAGLLRSLWKKAQRLSFLVLQECFWEQVWRVAVPLCWVGWMGSFQGWTLDPTRMLFSSVAVVALSTGGFLFHQSRSFLQAVRQGRLPRDFPEGLSPLILERVALCFSLLGGCSGMLLVFEKVEFLFFSLVVAWVFWREWLGKSSKGVLCLLYGPLLTVGYSLACFGRASWVIVAGGGLSGSLFALAVLAKKLMHLKEAPLARWSHLMRLRRTVWCLLIVQWMLMAGLLAQAWRVGDRPWALTALALCNGAGAFWMVHKGQKASGIFSPYWSEIKQALGGWMFLQVGWWFLWLLFQWR